MPDRGGRSGSRTTETGLFVPFPGGAAGQEGSLDETFRNLKRNRPDVGPYKLDRTRELMADAIRDVLVKGYEPLIDVIDLPDPGDRHVLAAAVRAKAQVIVTFNLKDFPPDKLSPWDVQAVHPDAFIEDLVCPLRLHQAALRHADQDVTQGARVQDVGVVDGLPRPCSAGAEP
ncbi:PIN domain-containing protein [Streptomyces buecherae]|uniref:PIN domain-containing protein n=2 Tax=Streptomyces buecherae TaxID=2763006 RepID=A0A7H8NMB9_9ACTN|nr:PIN domain-containing protein [Streptomyces buecherae]